MDAHIQSVIKYNVKPPQTTLFHDDYTIGWISALPLEMAAATAMLDMIHSNLPLQSTDHNAYVLGRIGEHNIVIACAPNGVYGTTSAATVATNLLSSFPSVRYGLLVGIGGGIPSKDADIRLGDVVVSKPTEKYGGVVQYDFGKALEGGQFQRGGVLNQPPLSLLTAQSKLEAQRMTEGNRITRFLADMKTKLPSQASDFGRPKTEDCLYQSDYDHVPSNTGTCEQCDLTKRLPRSPRSQDEEPVIHYGVIASGNRVVRDSKLRDKLSRELGAKCVEMEAAGLMNAFGCLVIRGICDYADSHKNKDWQNYAAAVAAAYAKWLLLSVSVVQPDSRGQKGGRHVLSPESPLITFKQINTLNNFNFEYFQDKNHCLRDLRLNDQRDDKHRIERTKDRLLKDSYAWILSHDTFRQWQKDNDCRLLWIHGDAGKGKTMLLMGITNEIEMAAPSASTLSYFFCQSTSTEHNQATAVLRGLIYLLLTRQELLIPYLQREYDRASKKMFAGVNGFYNLSRIFKEILQDPRLHAVYLVIDALDECNEERELLLDLINETSCLPNTKAKWIVSSRNWPEIESKLVLLENKVRLSLEVHARLVSDAIDAYICHKVDGLHLINRDRILQDRVKEVVRQKADGTYLWVCLIFKELERVSLKADILPVLEAVPPGLDQLYLRMMDQICQHTQERELCFRILSLTVLAYRPLHLLELYTLADLEVHEFSIEDLATIIELCRSFLTIRNEHVYLIHQSAKDYLSSAKCSGILFPDGSNSAHLKISLRSVRALSSSLRRNIYGLKRPGCSGDEVVKPSPDPLAAVRYSCVFLFHHLSDSQFWADNDRKHLFDGQEMLGFLTTHLLHWLEGLSLIDGVAYGIWSFRNFTYMVQQSDALKPEFLVFLKDIESFILAYGSVIERYPLQVYAGALTFCPTLSEVKKRFWTVVPHLVDNVAGIQERWDSCLQTIEGHDNIVRSVTFTPDGKMLASSSDDATIRLWDAATGSMRRIVEGHTGFVRAMACSADGLSIVSGSFDETVRLWDVQSGVLLRTLRGHSNIVNGVAFSPDNRMVASASDDQTIRIWDMSTGETIKILTGHNGWVRRVAFSPDQNRPMLISTSDDATVRLWDILQGTQLKLLRNHKGTVVNVNFSRDGSMFATSSHDTTVKIWDFKGHLKRTLKCNSPVNTVAFSPDNRLIASGSDDSVIRLWNSATGACEQVFVDHKNPVFGIAFSPDGNILASCSADRTIKMWNTAKKSLDHRGKAAHNSSITALCFSPDGTVVASAADKTILLWDPVKGRPKQMLYGHSHIIRAITFSPNAKLLASASDNNDIRIWRSDSGIFEEVTASRSTSLSPELPALGSKKVLTRLNKDIVKGLRPQDSQGHRYPIRAIVFSLDNKILVSGSNDHTVRLWDVALGTQKHVLNAHTDRVRSVLFSGDGKLLVSVADDGIVKVWEYPTGALKKIHYAHRDEIWAAAFSPDNEFFATASVDMTVHVWATRTWTCQKVFKGHSRCPRAVTFLQNGTRVASAAEDGTVQLWSTDKNDPSCQILTGHTSSVNTLAFCPRRSILASGSNDHTIRMWDVITGFHKSTLHGHCGTVNAVEFAPNGMLLASASDDKSVRLWDVSSGSHLATFDGHSLKVVTVAFSANGKFVASASDDATINLWDVKSGALKHTLNGQSDLVRPLTFSPDSTTLAAGLENDTIQTWDTTTGTRKLKLEGHSDNINDLAFSQKGKLLISASHDWSLKLWDSTSGALIRTFNGHTDWIRGVAFSPDGNMLASAADDSRVIIWNVEAGTSVCELNFHDSKAYIVAFSQDGKILASVTSDNRLCLWDIASRTSHLTMKLNYRVKFLSFVDDKHLRTDRGILDLNVPSPPRHLQADLKLSIFVSKEWITRDGKNILWLPTDYRATVTAMHANHLVLGHDTGDLTFMTFPQALWQKPGNPRPPSMESSSRMLVIRTREELFQGFIYPSSNPKGKLFLFLLSGAVLQLVSLLGTLTITLYPDIDSSAVCARAAAPLIDGLYVFLFPVV